MCAPALVEPISERELAVWRRLTTSLTAPEIAKDLVISVLTVRSHIQSICGKLGIRSRTQAVARARVVNLL
jgi:LuxR family maltose regulon positive regulatory protein